MFEVFLKICKYMLMHHMIDHICPHLSSRSRLAVMVALLTVVKCIVGRKQAESNRHCVSLWWLNFCL